MNETSADAGEHRGENALRAVLVAIGLTVFAILFAELSTMPVISVEPGLLEEPGETALSARTAYFVANFLGMAAAGGLYLWMTGRGWGYVDLRVPTLRDWLFVGIGTVATIGLYVVFVVAVNLLELPAADSGVLEFVGDDEAMIPIMIAIAFLFNAPAEEFLFRNVIQKRLYGAFGRIRAVFVASTIFALVHVPAFLVLAETAVAVVIPILMVFAGGIIFGYVFVRTENLVVPTIAHAVYNSFIWLITYATMVLDVEDPEAPVEVVALLVALL